MSELIPKPPVMIFDRFCGQCGDGLKVQDNFCRRCGTPTSTTTNMNSTSILTVDSKSPTTGSVSIPNQQTSGPASTVNTILNNRLYVGLVIALIGPLGLPALWFSPRFSNATKILLTSVFVLITTVVPIAVTWYYLESSARPLVEALGGNR